MISQGQKIKISNTLTEKGRWDDTQRPFLRFSPNLYIENSFYLHIEIDSIFYRNIILSLPFLPLLFPP